MICRRCKSEIPDNANLCCYCGTKLVRKHNAKTRGNGEGTAVRRGRGWEARVVIGWKILDDHPVPIRRSKGGFGTKRDALAYCVTLAAQSNGIKRKAPTLQHYYETYYQNELQRLSDSKQTAYRIAWSKLSTLHMRRVDTLTVADLRNTVSEACPSYYPARDCKVLLNHLFELAGAEGWVSKDLPSYIVLPEKIEKEREVFTPEEQKALWQLYEAGDMDAAKPLVMICTGMMPGEMQNLRVEHIHLNQQLIIGVGMKTKVRKASPIYLPEDIIPVIEDLIAHAPQSGYIFPRNESAWYESYYAALEKAGCRRLEPYCCRHSTATRLAITEGIAPQTIQRIMRWSSTKMLDRYAHPDTDNIIAAANTIRKAE